MELHDLDTAWETWMLMEATGWQFLPHAGGLLDQDQALQDDLMTIAAVAPKVKESLTTNV